MMYGKDKAMAKGSIVKPKVYTKPAANGGMGKPMIQPTVKPAYMAKGGTVKKGMATGGVVKKRKK